MNTTKTLLALSVALTMAQPAFAATELKKTKVADENKSVSTTKKSVSSDDIDSEMIAVDDDITRYISGISMAKTGNRFGSNGFNIRGMEGDAVAITIDGISQGESLDPPSFSRYGMFSSTRNSIELESVKTVRVLKGANSVTAGSGALGGAVMYTTKDAADFLDGSSDDFGGTVKIGYDGRDNEKLVSVAVAKQLNDFHALAILTSREGNELKAHDDGADVTGETRGQADPRDKSQKNVLVKLGYDFADDSTFGVVFEDYSKESEGKALSRESSSYSNFTFDDTSERQRVGVFVDWATDAMLFDEMSAKIDTQEVFTSGITAFDFGSQSAYLRTEDRNYEQDSTLVSVDFSKMVNTGDVVHDINYGFTHNSGTSKNSLRDIRYNGLTKDTGLRDGYPIIDPSWVPETDTKTIAVYLRDAITLTDDLTLTAGVRYDKTEYEPNVDDTFTDTTGSAVKDSKFDALSSQISASYQLAPSHSILASVSTGFKAPTTQQLYLNTNSTGEFVDAVRTVDSATGAVSYTPTGRTEIDLNTVTNQDLEAEKGVNVELSYTWETDDASISLTAFNSAYDNRIINEVRTSTFATPLTTATSSRFNPACNVPVVGDACYSVSTVTGDEWFVPTNSGEVTVRGFEVDAKWAINDELDLRVSYSHAQGEYDKTAGENTKGDKLESVAPDSAVVRLNYIAESRQWGINSSARYYAAADKEEYFDATFYSDSATVVDITAFYNITDDLIVRGGIYNAFDKNYSEWQAVRNVRQGSGGFFGGVDYNAETGHSSGIGRYSRPGREFVVNLSYRF